MSIGPLLSGKTVRDAAEATLRLWLPSVLLEVETAYDLDAGSLKVPADHAYMRMARIEDLLLKDAPRPAIVLVTPSKDMVKRGNGRYDASYLLLVHVVVGGSSFADTVDRADFYGVAVEAALTQHPALAPYGDDPVAQDVWLLDDYVYTPIGDGDRTVMQVTVPFGVRLADVLDSTAGPLEPPPAEWPFPVEITETEIVVEPMEA